MLSSQASSHSIVVLVIEDDKSQAEYINFILRDCDWVHHVELARDGEEALQLLCADNHPDDDLAKPKAKRLPQAIVLDLHLPKLHGLEVLKRLKSEPLTQHIPTIVLSASYIARDMKKSYDLGAISFLRKPVCPDDLITVMEYSLRHQRTI
jgi:CheY-like chemotaxis protein